ncbi:YihY/virulence factor BrkB family protein [Paracoccus sp. M683]|uniref:YihY/virulence factor BrkB family protein n=1 Tax=Paracoccus sp. M683 TaxID=2594268 RepID=UPI00117F0CAA|nr:YihY/virulence factor BrkB family protein [Paracoccus sp. M683]TRW97268.1 YihY/virulence factor BrkB family protein [Paracoccus sp. M683]
MSDKPSRPPSVLDALFDDLDDQTRQRFGIGQDRERAEGLWRRRRRRLDFTEILPPPDQVGPPGAAKSPWQLSMSDWVAIAKRTMTQIGEDRVTAVAAGVTFFSLLALFPAITAFVSIYGLFADPQKIVDNFEMLNRFIPAEALRIVLDQTERITAAPQAALSFASVMGLLIAFYSANGGTKAMISAMNVAWFQKEKRGILRLNLLAMGFTMGAAALVVVMFSLIAVLPAVVGFLPVDRYTEALVSWLRWPIIFVAAMLALAVFYRFGPSRRSARWHWITPGALFAAVGLGAASMLFSWYAGNFANYNQTYGSLGAVVGLMMWLWIASMVVIVGAEINSEVERQIKMDNQIPVPGDPQADEGGPKKLA